MGMINPTDDMPTHRRTSPERSRCRQSHLTRAGAIALALATVAVATAVEPAAEPREEQAAEQKPDIKPLAQPKPVPAKPAPMGGQVQVQVQVGGGARPVVVVNGGGNVQVNANVQVNGNAFAVSADGSEIAEETVFRDPPRPLMQRFKRSEELIAEKRFAEAVEQLGGILEEPEDYSATFEEQSTTRRSLKGEAQRRIGLLPAEGRDAYELQYGAKAKKLLEQSIAEGDEIGLAEVARRYFHTAAGYQATYLLGMQHLDHNRPLAAALCLRRLKDVPAAVAEFEPELSLKLAASWARAGVNESAATVLDDAKKRFPSAAFDVGGQPLRWYGAGEQPQAWLASRLMSRGEAAALDTRPEQWAIYRGDAARNAVGTGGSPLLNRRWAVPFANHPDIEKLIEHLRKTYGDLDTATLPATHPLAVNDVVLMRTLTGLTAVDFRTGKRIWRGADDEFAKELLARESPLARGRQDQEPNQLMMLVDERLWRDAAYGTFSSDETAAYCIEAASQLQQQNNMQRTVILAGGRRIMSGDSRELTNRLAAYELATQGKLLWEIGGSIGSSDPALEGTYFLGAPLPIGDRLYVLGESRGEIRLIVLEARTGKLDWAQQLALANDPANIDLRHTCGLSPSYADGVLICPTSLGAVVAVDLNDRSLLWGFQYPRQANRYSQGFMAFQINGRQGSDDMNRWQDATIALVDGRAYLAPPESDKLFCVNLLDGKLLWKQERGQGLYVACVNDGIVTAVAANEVRGYDAVDGKLKWTLPLPEGAKPSGRGFFNGKSYFLPLTTAEVAAIDVQQGRFQSRSKSRSGSIPGNLICYRGAVISQGTGGLECFFQLEDLRRDVKNKLADKPDDAAALASSGELLLDEGKVAEAIETLRRSYRTKADPRTRNLFLDALLEGLSSGVAVAGADLDDLEQLAIGTEREELYLRQRALAHEKAGDAKQALAQYLRLIDATNLADEPIRSGNDNVAIRRELWVRTRLDSLASTGGAEAAKALSDEIERRRGEALASGDANRMRRFLDYFGDHPAADQLRLELAAQIQDKSPLEAENLLRRVADSADASVANKAALQIVNLMAEPRPEDAAAFLADWRAAHGDVDLELPPERQARLDQSAQTARHVWPVGKVEVEEVRSQTGMSFRQFPLEFRGGRGPYFRDVVVEMDQPTQSLVGHDRNGVERWRISLTEPNRRGINQFNPIVTHLRVDGHLLIVSLGHEVVAVDTLGTGAKGSSRVLWRHDLTESLPGMSAGNVPQVHLRNVQMNWGVQRFFAQTPDGSPIGMTGPATLRYVSFLKRRALYVVEPLTGKTLWIRHDVDPGSEVFGDDEYLFVSPPSGESALVLSAADGRQIKQVKLPKAEERVMALGRKLVSWRFEGRKAHLSMLDMLEEKPLWSHELSSGSRLWPISGEEVGVMDRKGSFKIVGIDDGEIRLSAELQPEPQLSEAYVFRSAGNYLLLTNSPHRPREGINVQPVQGGYQNPLINGYLYGFDRETKKQLYKVRIEGHGLTLHQPEDSPLLVFASQIYETPRNGQMRSPQGVLLCIDKRNGRTIYDKRLPQAINMIDIVGEPERNAVSLRMMRNMLRFTFTDEPYTDESPAPQPTDNGARSKEGAAGALGKAIVGGAQDLGAAIREVNEEAERQKQLNPAAPAPAPAPQEKE